MLAIALFGIAAAAAVWLLSPRGRRGPVTVEGSVRWGGAAKQLPHFRADEIARLDAARIWLVRSRDSASSAEINVAVCFSETDALAEAHRRGADHPVLGPVAPRAEFIDEGDPDNVLRIILERLASGSRAPISLRDG